LSPKMLRTIFIALAVAAYVYGQSSTDMPRSTSESPMDSEHPMSGDTKPEEPRPVEETPHPDEPTDDMPHPDEHTDEEPHPDAPTGEEPHPDAPTGEEPHPDESTTEKPEEDKPTDDKPDEDKPDNQKDLTTGGNDEYTKYVKGDLKHDPKTFRTYLKDDKSYLSYWHDAPLFFDENEKTINMIVEIPRGQGMKIESRLDEPMNPLEVVLDEHDEPIDEHVDYIHHFGLIPQTFADSAILDTLSGLTDNDRPLAVVEISDSMHDVGDVVPVKVLGALGVIDDGKLIEYKIIAIDIHSQFAQDINTLEDVEKHFPDLLSATRGFFRYYRYPEKLYDIAFSGEYKDAKVAMDVITEKHDQWYSLIKNDNPPAGLNIETHEPEAARPADDEQWKSIAEA